MTLILAAATRRHTVIVTDRRTVAGDQIHSEETGKLGVAFFDDARVAVAYAGLAEFGTFKTRFWLPSTLADIATDGLHDFVPVVHELKDRLEVALKNVRGLPADNSGLTILLSG
jgi:hypothetical protein